MTEPAVTEPVLTVLSLGAGVQSTALLVLSGSDDPRCPRADVAIFADTGDEPRYVVGHGRDVLDWART